MANKSVSAVKSNRDNIIARLSNGERLADIGASIGVSSQAISNRLAGDEEYQSARIASLDARMDKREDELERAPDNVSVARARELLSHARWRAEREAPAIWGAKSEVSHGVHVAVTINNPTLPSARTTVTLDHDDGMAG